MSEAVQIISFYEFKEMPAIDGLANIKESLRGAMAEHNIRGTVILADEGFNASLCGLEADVPNFLLVAESILQTVIRPKVSSDRSAPFRKIDVKIKPEIVSLRRPVRVADGKGTHVKPKDWNRVISDPGTLVLDARNDYEFRSGTFKNAVNPATEKFSDLPDFVQNNLDSAEHNNVAMFCTGGIRCEKFVPYMKSLGFENVFQLEGGILKYLEEVPVEEQLWEGECYVFDTRVSVNRRLEKGNSADLSSRFEGHEHQ